MKVLPVWAYSPFRASIACLIVLPSSPSKIDDNLPGVTGTSDEKTTDSIMDFIFLKSILSKQAGASLLVYAVNYFGTLYFVPIIFT